MYNVILKYIRIIITESIGIPLLDTFRIFFEFVSNKSSEISNAFYIQSVHIITRN